MPYKWITIDPRRRGQGVMLVETNAPRQQRQMVIEAATPGSVSSGSARVSLVSDDSRYLGYKFPNYHEWVGVYF